jgi:hypothetical protein
VKWLAALLLFVGIARAQPADLAAEVDKLKRALAELPSTASAVHDLANRVSALEAELERLRHASELAPATAKILDSVAAELAVLTRRTERLESHLVLLERASRAQLGLDGGLYLQVLRGLVGPGHSIGSRTLFDERPPVPRDHDVLFELSIAGGIQARYAGAIRTNVDNASGFDLHHGQFGLRASMAGLVETQLMLDVGAEPLSLGAAGIVRDAYIDILPTSWLTVRAGQFRVPLGRQRLISEMRLLFAEKSAATRALTFDRDIGALAMFRLLSDRLRIEAAVTDGIRAGANTANDNLDLAYTVRVVGSPLGPLPLEEGDLRWSRRPRLSFGLAAQYTLTPTTQPPPLNDIDHDGRIDNIEVITVDAELAFRIWGFALEAEYIYRHERPGGGRAPRALQGFYGQVSHAIWRGLGLGARAGFTDVPDGVILGLLDNPNYGAPVALSHTIEAGGLFFYTVLDGRIRAQLAYDFRRDFPLDPVGLVRDNHLITVQVQASF